MKPDKQIDRALYNPAVARPNCLDWFSVIAVLTIAATCAGQTPAPPKKTAPKVHRAAPSFVCPDPEAQQACKSYEELLTAKDTGLPTDAYVCFRQKQDEFFVVWFWKPYFPRRWDPDLKQMVIDTEAKYRGHGYARTYKDGVEDSTVMPSLYFSGTWITWLDSGTFSSDRINLKKSDEDSVVISIDESQFIIDRYKYQNKFGKTVQYNLTIQRSTGRFSENFQEESNLVPLIQTVGHCVYRKGK